MTIQKFEFEGLRPNRGVPHGTHCSIRIVRSRLRTAHTRRSVDDNWSKDLWRDYMRLLEWRSDYLKEQQKARRLQQREDNTEKYVAELRQILFAQ